MTTIELSAGPAAFGDGTHPTTAGVLAALQAIDPAEFSPRSACDIGAGSGIISFALVEKFHCPVVAVDIERSAVATIRENAARNGVPLLDPSSQPSPAGGEGVLALQADGFDHPEITVRAPYDLIVMNILAPPLLKLAADAEHRLATGGVLIISGILLWQEDQIREAYQVLGLELSFRIAVGDWVTLVWQQE